MVTTFGAFFNNLYLRIHTTGWSSSAVLSFYLFFGKRPHRASLTYHSRRWNQGIFFHLLGIEVNRLDTDAGDQASLLESIEPSFNVVDATH